LTSSYFLTRIEIEDPKEKSILKNFTHYHVGFILGVFFILLIPILSTTYPMSYRISHIITLSLYQSGLSRVYL